MSVRQRIPMSSPLDTASTGRSIRDLWRHQPCSSATGYWLWRGWVMAAAMKHTRLMVNISQQRRLSSSFASCHVMTVIGCRSADRWVTAVCWCLPPRRPWGLGFNNSNTVISIALFTERPGSLTRTSDVSSTKWFSFEAALEKTSVTDLLEMVWKTVPCSRSSMQEAALSELGSAPQLGVDSCVGGSETRSTAGTCDCLNAIR